MKKLLLLTILVSLGLTSAALAYEQRTMYSSFTTTNDTLQRIPNARTIERVVASSVTTGGLLKIYDSSATATNQIAAVTLNSANFYPFEVQLSSGLTYSTTGNANGVTIIYTK